MAHGNRNRTTTQNLDPLVVHDFGREWQRFDQSGVPEEELQKQFNRYFAIFPWDSLPVPARGFDLGCGSGRWAKFVAPRVGELVCVDPSELALATASRNLVEQRNCEFVLASADALPFPDESMDFCYSLGVLHHIPDTAEGVRACARKLKRGAPMLLYLYYRFDNRPAWFRWLWRISNWARNAISRSPSWLKNAVCEVIAAIVYWPLARVARTLGRLGLNVTNFPLSHYKNASFYTMRTDALDRFGTRLEQRFTRQEISDMMRSAGLIDIRFSSGEPYWCAVGFKA